MQRGGGLDAADRPRGPVQDGRVAERCGAAAAGAVRADARRHFVHCAGGGDQGGWWTEGMSSVVLLEESKVDSGPKSMSSGISVEVGEQDGWLTQACHPLY